MEFPKRGNYRHFKGNMYELIDFARHSETQEWMVIYRALYGDWGIWVRPLSMWNETVERDGKLVPRFALIPDGEETTVPETEFSDEHVPEREGNAFDSESTDEKHKVLKQYFGYDLFREGQELAIDSILSGKDTLAVMPTGAGKSVCYQIPALMSSGISIVISPLISLMKDQVQTLSGNGIPAAYLNSSLTEKQFDLAVENVLKGKYKILYVAPERLLTRRFLSAISHANITLVAVDEAHCISQWGQDFRPSYLTIPEFLECLNRRPVVCAFTATATHQVREDIQTLLGMCKPEVIVTGFDRTNLYYSVCEPSSKDDQVLRLAKMYRGFSGIVYCATRKNVEKVFELLLSRGFSVTRYHAGLTDAERRTNQEDFSYDRKEIMVATNAFGMGIDKSDVRFIIHYNMPKDLESYYQEAGRAGRDGERADCHLLFAKQDIITQNFFIDHMGEEAGLEGAALQTVQDAARARLKVMIRYCQSPDCLRIQLLKYFGQDAKPCDFCSNCLTPPQVEDVTEAAGIVLRCVAHTGSRFGQGMIVDILKGSKSEKIRKLRLDQIPEYGCLQPFPREKITRLLDRLLEDDVLMTEQILTRSGQLPVLKPGTGWDAVLKGEISVHISVRHARISGGRKRSGKRETLVVADPALYQKLVLLRKQIAAQRHVPPYVVFTDHVLRQLSERKPRTLEQLLDINGIGLVKQKQFGEIFLEAINSYPTERI